MIANHFVENIPDIFVAALQHSLRAFDCVCVAKLLQAANNERLEQLQCDLLGETALMQFQSGTNDDHTTS